MFCDASFGHPTLGLGLAVSCASCRAGTHKSGLGTPQNRQYVLCNTTASHIFTLRTSPPHPTLLLIRTLYGELFRVPVGVLVRVLQLVRQQTHVRAGARPHARAAHTRAEAARKGLDDGHLEFVALRAVLLEHGHEPRRLRLSEHTVVVQDLLARLDVPCGDTELVSWICGPVPAAGGVSAVVGELSTITQFDDASVRGNREGLESIEEMICEV